MSKLQPMEMWVRRIQVAQIEAPFPKNHKMYHDAVKIKIIHELL